MEARCSRQSSRRLRYAVAARLDDLITDEIGYMKLFGNPFVEHKCTTIGCFGAAEDGYAYDAVVIDGIECIQGHR